MAIWANQLYLKHSTEVIAMFILSIIFLVIKAFYILLSKHHLSLISGALMLSGLTVAALFFGEELLFDLPYLYLTLYIYLFLFQG